MKTTSSLRKIRRGFTLIEILLVVGFIAIAGLVVYSIYNKAQTTNLANLEADKFNVMLAGVKTLYGGRNNVDGLTPALLVSSGIVSKEELTAPNSNLFRTSWGETMTVAQEAVGSRWITFTYNDVPSEICIKLVNSISLNAMFITVGTTNLKDETAGASSGSGTGKATDPTATTLACSSASSTSILVKEIM